MTQIDLYGNEGEARTDLRLREFERALRQWAEYEERKEIRSWEAGAVYHRMIGHCEPNSVHERRREAAAASARRLGCCGAASARGSTQMRLLVDRGLARITSRGHYRLTFLDAR